MGLLTGRKRPPLLQAVRSALATPLPASLVRSLGRWMLAHEAATLVFCALLAAAGANFGAVLATASASVPWAALLWLLFRIHLTLVRTPQGHIQSSLGLPNALTTFRIVFAPAVGLLLVSLDDLGPRALPLLVGLWAVGLTDSLDGYLARRTGRVTVFGRDLDPAADIVTSVTATAALTWLGAVPTWFAALVLVRYLGALAGLVVLLGLGRLPRVSSTKLGKVTTPALQVYLFLAAYRHLALGGLAARTWALSARAERILCWLVAGLVAASLAHLTTRAARSGQAAP